MKEYLKIFILLLFFFLGFVPKVFAENINIFDIDTGKIKDKIVIDSENKAFNIAVGDLRNDGNNEIILAPVYHNKGKILIYDADGSFVNSFYAYDENITTGISITVGDFDGDGRAELATVTGRGLKSFVKFFDLNGNEVLKSFLAFNNYNGAVISSANIDGDKKDELLLSNIYNNKAILNIVDYTGKIKQSFEIKGLNSMYALNMTAIDLSEDGYDEIAVAGQYGAETRVNLYLANGHLLDSKLLYNAKNKMGLYLSSANIDKEKGEELIVAPLFSGGPYVKIFDSYLQFKKGFFTNNYKRDYGLSIAIADIDNDGKLELLTVKNGEKAVEKEGHFIDINVSSQRFKYYDNGYLIEDMITSTGKASTPTKIGTFHVQTKLKMAYGGIPGQKWAMPYWVGFYYVGSTQNGIHALPYINGVKESSRDLGRAVSHGCVRLSDWEIARFYNWVKIGDTIKVHK